MKNTNIIQVLSALTLLERKQFSTWLAVPSNGMSTLGPPLLEGLLTQLDHQAIVDKERLFKCLYPTQNFNEARWNNLLSDLLHAVYQFLQQQALQQQPLLQQNLLLKTLLEREILGVFPRQSKKQAQLLQQSPALDPQHFYFEYHLAQYQDEYQLLQEKRNYSPFLQAKNDALDLYYFFEKLRIACDMASRNLVMQADYRCPFVDHFCAHYAQELAEQNLPPVVLIYYNTYKLLTENDSRHYFQIKPLLVGQLDQLPNAELRTLYSYLLNHCVRQINSGNSLFYAEILSLYKLLLEHSILITNGRLTQWTFTNIVTTGIRLRDYAWTEQFILQYAGYIHAEVRENARCFNLANLYFEKGDYGPALQQLQSLEFTDPFYHVSAKIIQLKIYYLLHEAEALFFLMENTKRLILRNKQLSEYQKKSNLNFIKILQKLAKSAPTRAHTAQSPSPKILELIERSTPLANKDWLLQQLP
ncbi:hypothetical protein [Haliscomenobacter sp.]|uniref:hypothetical protein n=1 Tax=Haliscomenobacter sp. TaxID=2717303 RepID=UPI0035935B04